MVFPSVPVYLDSPSNWHQQIIHQTSTTSNNENPQLPSLPSGPPLPPAGDVGGGTSSTRPNSMTDLARIVKISQPEVALKCPRCDSNNTKFCYYNNYNLTQPRHFCKTCRRYWTKGGALRNVPVGGGCRRNKRTKSSRSKSPVTNSEYQTGSSSNNSILASSSCTGTAETINRIGHHHLQQQVPFISSLHHLSNYGGTQTQMGRTHDLGFQIGSNSSSIGRNVNVLGNGSSNAGGGGTILSNDQWQPQRFPFFGSFEAPQGLYPFASEDEESLQGQVKPELVSTPATSQDRMNSLKMEWNDQRLNLSRQFLDNIQGNGQYLGRSAWTNLSSYTSSSTSHLL